MGVVISSVIYKYPDTRPATNKQENANPEK